MNKMFFIAVIVALPVGLGSEVLAQDGIDQPLNEVFQTELVYPQEKGAFQFTSVATFSRPDKNFSNDLTIEYGLTHAWQISLEWESFARKKADNGLMSHGSGDVRIGTKYSFMNIRGSNFHSAIGFELGLPAASAKAQISERQIEYEPYVIVAKDFPNLSRLQLFTQLGLNFAHPVTRSEDSRAVKTVEWNSGMFVPYRRARITTEISWSKSANENSVYFTPGVVWKLPRNVEVGAGVPIGLTRDADSFRMIVKLVYEFGGAGDRQNERLAH